MTQTVLHPSLISAESPRPLPDSVLTTPGALADVARVLAEREHVWATMVEFDPAERWYARFAGGRGWEAWLLSWLPGQGTGLHGHGTSSGAFIVLQGYLRESTLSSPVAAHTPARLHDRVIRQSELRAFGRDHIHDVVNDGPAPAVSLHVYAPVLSSMTRYHLDVAGLLRETVTERAGVQW